MSAEDLEDILERAFWRFDALHKHHYKTVDPKLPGAMNEREAFKHVVRGEILDVLGVTYSRGALPAPGKGEP